MILQVKLLVWFLCQIFFNKNKIFNLFVFNYYIKNNSTVLNRKLRFKSINLCYNGNKLYKYIFYDFYSYLFYFTHFCKFNFFLNYCLINYNLKNYNFMSFINTRYFNEMFFSVFYKNYLIFNSSVYNFYLNNEFMLYKSFESKKNNPIWFLIRFFLKKKKKKQPRIRKRKFLRFRRFRRFKKFKKLRRHIKIFRLKKKKRRKKIPSSKIKANYLYFYNFFTKFNYTKKPKLKTSLFNHTTSKKLVEKVIFFQSISFFFNQSPFFLINYNYRYKITFKFIKFFKNYSNLNFFKDLKRLKLKFLKNFFFRNKYLSHPTLFKNNFIIFNFIILYDFSNKTTHLFFKFKFLKKIHKILPFLRKKIRLKRKRRKLRWFKKRFFIKNKLLKKKKQTKWKKRRFIIMKIRSRKQTYLLKKQFYKILISNLLFFHRFNYNFLLNVHIGYNNPLSAIKSIAIKKKIRKKIILYNFLKFNNLNNVLYNNYFPIYSSSSFLIKKFKKVFRSFLVKKYHNSLQYYVVSFFEKFFEKKIFIKALNYNFFKKKKYKKRFKFFRLYKIYRKNKQSVLSRKTRFNLIEILEIILFSFYYKDIYILKNWFLRNFIRLHHKNQRNFLSLFKVMITDVFETYKHIFKLKGFYFILKGKVGVTSNAKKKTVLFRIGPISKSSKFQKINFQQGVVKALSGTSGLLMILTYN